MLNTEVLKSYRFLPIMLDVNIKTMNDVTIIELHGELDSLVPQEVQQQIINQSSPGCKIILDMTDVKYLSSAGLRTLLLLYRQIDENKGQIIISGLTEDVEEIMAITGFLEFFKIVPSRHAAMEAFH